MDNIEKEVKDFLVLLATRFRDGESIEVEVDTDTGLVTVKSLDRKLVLRKKLSPAGAVLLYNILNSGATITVPRNRTCGTEQEDTSAHAAQKRNTLNKDTTQKHDDPKKNATNLRTHTETHTRRNR